MDRVLELVECLNCKDNSIACNAMKLLEEESNKNELVYKYFDRFVEMLHSKNSYVRNRGLTLIAANAKWDINNKIDGIIDEYLKHIIDVKPITSRQCIKGLIKIAKYKPDLCYDIKKALQGADVTRYSDSMQSLLYKDIVNAIKEIG